MRQVSKKKKITITTKGPLRIKGGIKGPIDTPYSEDVSTIGRMVISGYKVFEHLSDGSIVKLDIHNYDKENGTNDMEIKYAPIASAKEIVVDKPKSKTKGTDNAKLSPTIDIYIPKH